MKNIKFIALLTFCITSNYIFAQLSQDWKIQATGYIIEGYTTNNPDDYTWHEESNKSQGVHISLLPAEKIPVFVEQYNNYIAFNTFTTPTSGNEFIINIDVNINNNGFINLYNGSPTLVFVWENSSNVFSSLGSYNLKVKIQEAMGTEYSREYEIIVVPSSNKLFKDNYGNSLRLWEGNNPGYNIPVLFSEGFDAYDTNPQQMYYYAASDLMSCMRDNGFDVYLLDNIYGTQDIRNNAAGFSAAAMYISELYDNELIIAGGVSMGGMIARYALAKAENDGNPLPVYTFISVDSPQQGAIISKSLQDYKKEKTEGDAFAEHALKNIAAKQLLNYSTYDPDGSIHNAFYAELNSLNGDGYPHQTKNIGVSFSTGSSNPNSGSWLTIKWKSGWFNGEEKSFELSAEEKVAGSYLPVDLTTTAPFIMRKFAWYWNFLIQPWNYPVITITRSSDPAYIAYESALDIVDSESKFDVVIEPEQTSHHDVLPPEIINEIINELKFADIYLQNQTIISNNEYVGKIIFAGKNVNNNIPPGDFIISNGVEVNLIATNEVRLMDGFIAEEGSVFNVNIDENLNISCSKQKKHSPESNNSSPNQQVAYRQYITLSNFPAKEIHGNVRLKDIANNKVFIYPNPTKGIINIQINGNYSEVLNIKVINSLGEVVSFSDNIQGENSIDISHLPKGIYYLNILCKNDILSHKIILR